MTESKSTWNCRQFQVLFDSVTAKNNPKVHPHLYLTLSLCGPLFLPWSPPLPPITSAMMATTPVRTTTSGTFLLGGHRLCHLDLPEAQYHPLYGHSHVRFLERLICGPTSSVSNRKNQDRRNTTASASALHTAHRQQRACAATDLHSNRHAH